MFDWLDPDRLPGSFGSSQVQPNRYEVFVPEKKVDWQKDPLDLVNSALRGGLAGSESGFDRSKGCESSGSG